MAEVIRKIKDGIQYGIGIAIGMLLLNMTVGLLMAAINFVLAIAALKAGLGVVPPQQ